MTPAEAKVARRRGRPRKTAETAIAKRTYG
jgi:hypothetical protein